MTVLWLLKVKSKKDMEICRIKKIKTGEWEIIPQEMHILAVAKTAPFRQGDTVSEDMALKYRYLDFRSRKELKI